MALVSLSNQIPQKQTLRRFMYKNFIKEVFQEKWEMG